MKVARFSRTRPVLTASELFGSITAGPDGQVVTSIGSNTVSWGSNISDIFVNGTDHVLGPYVNIANGSNTTVTVDKVGSVPSNTIRIHATSGGSVSFGSNSTRVSEISSAGVSTDSSRADHIHDGIGTITASSSNTLQRGTWNLRAGTGIALALSDADGDGEFDTTTIVNTGSAGGGGGGSSSTFGDGKPYNANPPASPDSTDDEFNDTTGMSGPNNGLDAKWSKHNLGTSSWIVLSDTVAPGEIYFDIPSGQSASQAIYQTVPAGDWTFAARTKLQYASERTMWGIICVNTSGTGVCAVLDTTALSLGIRTLTTWTDGGAGTFFGSSGSWLNDQAGTAPHIIVTLRKASGVYHCGVSYSDRLMPGNYFEVSHTPSSFTAAYIGFGRIFSTGQNKVELDFFRKVA